MSHTPGPWHADEHMRIVGANGDLICDVDPFAMLPETQTNLALIAGAPDQHALLVKALDLVPRISEDDPMAGALAEWCRDVRAVIAKV